MALSQLAKVQLARDLTLDAAGIQAPNHSHTSVNATFQVVPYPAYVLGYNPQAVPEAVALEMPDDPQVNPAYLETPHPYQHVFSRANLPPQLFQLEPSVNSYQDIPVPKICDAKTGEIIKGNRGEPLRHFSFLPRRMPHSIGGGIMELWFRLDSRLVPNDILDRMVASAGSKLPDGNTLSNRRRRFREELNTRAYLTARSYPCNNEIDELSMLTKEQLLLNTSMKVDMVGNKLLKPRLGKKAGHVLDYVDSGLPMDYFLTNLVHQAPGHRQLLAISLRKRLQLLAMQQGYGSSFNNYQSLNVQYLPHWWQDRNNMTKQSRAQAKNSVVQLPPAGGTQKKTKFSDSIAARTQKIDQLDQLTHLQWIEEEDKRLPKDEANLKRCQDNRPSGPKLLAEAKRARRTATGTLQTISSSAVQTPQRDPGQKPSMTQLTKTLFTAPGTGSRVAAPQAPLQYLPQPFMALQATSNTAEDELLATETFGHNKTVFTFGEETNGELQFPGNGWSSQNSVHFARLPVFDDNSYPTIINAWSPDPPHASVGSTNQNHIPICTELPRSMSTPFGSGLSSHNNSILDVEPQHSAGIENAMAPGALLHAPFNHPQDEQWMTPPSLQLNNLGGTDVDHPCFYKHNSATNSTHQTREHGNYHTMTDSASRGPITNISYQSLGRQSLVPPSTPVVTPRYWDQTPPGHAIVPPKLQSIKSLQSGPTQSLRHNIDVLLTAASNAFKKPGYETTQDATISSRRPLHDTGYLTERMTDAHAHATSPPGRTVERSTQKVAGYSVFDCTEALHRPASNQQQVVNATQAPLTMQHDHMCKNLILPKQTSEENPHNLAPIVPASLAASCTSSSPGNDQTNSVNTMENLAGDGNYHREYVQTRSVEALTWPDIEERIENQETLNSDLIPDISISTLVAKSDHQTFDEVWDEYFNLKASDDVADSPERPPTQASLDSGFVTHLSGAPTPSKIDPCLATPNAEPELGAGSLPSALVGVVPEAQQATTAIARFSNYQPLHPHDRLRMSVSTPSSTVTNTNGKRRRDSSDDAAFDTIRPSRVVKTCHGGSGGLADKVPKSIHHIEHGPEQDDAEQLALPTVKSRSSTLVSHLDVLAPQKNCKRRRGTEDDYDFADMRPTKLLRTLDDSMVTPTQPGFFDTNNTSEPVSAAPYTSNDAAIGNLGLDQTCQQLIHNDVEIMKMLLPEVKLEYCVDGEISGESLMAVLDSPVAGQVTNMKYDICRNEWVSQWEQQQKPVTHSYEAVSWCILSNCRTHMRVRLHSEVDN